MTTEEKIWLFYDILETTSPAFKLTGERPITTVVLNYLNEAQLQVFNARYLPGDFVTNINTIKSLQAELGNLLEYDDTIIPTLSTKYNKSYSLGTVDWTSYVTFVDGSLEMDRDTLLEGTDLVTTLVPITQISISKYLTNHTNAPIILEPVVFMDKEGEDGLFILVDKFTTPTAATVTWLKKPSELTIDGTGTGSDGSELHERLHEEIVRLATRLFLQDKLSVTPKEKEENDGSGNAS